MHPAFRLSRTLRHTLLHTLRGNLRRTPARAASAVAVCAALLATPALAVPTLAVTGPATVAGGASFQLHITASGVADLVAFQFDLGFDPTLFSVDAVAEGGLLATAGSTVFDPGLVDNTAGSLSFVLGSLIGPGAGASGSGTLATLTLHSLAATTGSGSFRLLNVSAYDGALAPLAVSLQDHVVAVPEPATLALALAGLGVLGVLGAGAGGLRRGRRPAAATTAAA